MKSDAWKFWIDVGGTFTDCLAVDPDGIEYCEKVLSSATTKGIVASLNERGQLVSDRREPDGFWNGYRCRLLDGQGRSIADSTVSSFSKATGQLELDLQAPLTNPAAVRRYELWSRELAPILAVRSVLGCQLNEPLPPLQMKLGTTRGTNALLTRQGAKVALVTTRGFGDLLAIGDQNRPHLFELNIRKAKPLAAASIEIDERVAADGTVLQTPRPAVIRRQLEQLKADGFESIAVCLLHGYLFPDHERTIAEIANDVGFQNISTSSQVAPLIKMVPRAETTVLDAYLNPCLVAYLLDVQNSLPAGSRLELMTSSGGIVEADRFTGKDSVLSGPAGGVVGFARCAEQLGFDKSVGFDMGGTSTDVARYDGHFDRQYETTKAGVRIVHPVMAIETVAAGGGSICQFDGTRLTVGPESAGATPGPACYGNGGPLTITDVNLLLERIDQERFPFPLDLKAPRQRLRELLDSIRDETGIEYTELQLCNGFFQVANTHMAEAVRSISVAKGYKPSEYLLVAFGGAAPQHACPVADELGIDRVLIHPQGGILSAVGIRLATRSCHRVRPCHVLQSEFAKFDFSDPLNEMKNSARNELAPPPSAAAEISFVERIDARYRGTDFAITLPLGKPERIPSDFRREHQRQFGYVQDREIEIVAIRLEASLPQHQLPASTVPESPRQDPNEGSVPRSRIVDHEKLSVGDRLRGPQMIADRFSTVFVDEGWQALVCSGGQLLLSRKNTGGPTSHQAKDDSIADPILLEVFNRHFVSIAEQMGHTLRKTSISVNVKQRLDYSCALFSAGGELVVNAPHIPVHLGAMGESVKSIIARNPNLNPNDVFVTNDPYHGGSHLPDVTVVTPVFIDGQCEFFVACRCHHAEIGGISPGSMPANAKCLGEEGVLIDNFKVVDSGEGRFEELADRLTHGPYPSRSVSENLADLNAQIAANNRGVILLQKLAGNHGTARVRRYMDFMRTAARTKTISAIRKLPKSSRSFSDKMDDGSRICLTCTVGKERLHFDFSGTSPATSGNLNANRAIVVAAVMYCVRCLVAEDIPMNEGLLAPIDIELPECFLNPRAHPTDPAKSPAVVGGNVETSQRIVDVVLGALQLAAASQGTMNNLLMGDGTFGYYETICGGAGATEHGAGADAVHTHMTNTRITDPEVLESRYPVRLVEFSIRRRSGGEGKNRGGDGIVRSLEFLRPLTVSLLTNRRGQNRPFGLAGGGGGSPGQNLFSPVDGDESELPSQCEIQVQAGDRLTIKTPGGGGWGA